MIILIFVCFIFVILCVGAVGVWLAGYNYYRKQAKMRGMTYRAYVDQLLEQERQAQS